MAAVKVHFICIAGIVYSVNYIGMRSYTYDL